LGQRSKQPKRDNSSARAYFIREGLEVSLVLAGLSIAEWVTRVPLWVWIALPIGKTLTSILFYVLFLKRSLQQRPRHEVASLVGRTAPLVGRTARTLTPLNHNGQIKVGGEIWSARSHTGDAIPSNRDVLIREAHGNTLLVEIQADGQQSDNSMD